MSSTSPEEILEALFAALDAGQPPDEAALRARFPGHEQTIARLAASVAQYDRRRGALAGSVLELPAGTQLGDFVIEGLLRRGGMGVVYRARQRSLGDRLVALKVVPGGAHDPAQEQRFRREATLAASLHHVHLAEVYGFGHERELSYCAMRLVEGPTLHDVLERLARERRAGRTTNAQQRRQLVQHAAHVAAALALMHRAGLVHRDVKPANIVLDGSADEGALVPRAPAVLVDFGLARRIESPAWTRSVHASATLAFAPPEQLLGQADLDGRADVFALGVTLHDLLSARGAHERLQASAGLQPLHELVPDVDRDLEAVIAKATDPLPQFRYTDGAALQAELLAWLEGAPVTARALRPHERALRWMRRHPARVLRMLLLGLAALLALVIVVRVTEAVSLASEARQARTRGDLSAAAAALTELGGRPIGRLFMDAQERAVLAELRAAGPASGAEAPPLARVTRLLAEGRDDEALATLGRSLVGRPGRLEGPLLAHLLHRLELPDEARTSPPQLAPSLALVARAFYERPDVSPEDSADSAALRARLWQLLDDSRLSRDDHLNVLWALSGCGTPELLVAPERERDLLRWLTARPRDGEERRLGLLCLELILRRSARCGLRAALSSAECDRLDAGIAGLLLDAVDLSWEQRHAAELLAPAWAFFRRARGERANVPAEWRASMTPWGQLRLAVALGEEGCSTSCLDSGEPIDASRHWWRLGWRCGARQEAGTADGHVAGVPGTLLATRSGFPGWLLLGEFLAGAVAGAAEVDGVRVEDEPDRESHLDFRGEPRPAELCALRTPDGGSAGLLAEWQLLGPQVLLRGAARLPVVAVLVADGRPIGDPSCAVFRVFGESELRLRFVIEADLLARCAAEGVPVEPRLLLSHQAALRSAVPFGGRAELEITLDGVALVGGLAVPSPSVRVDSVPLASAQLTPGEHELVLRLAAGSTTTYRLRSVALSLHGGVDPLWR